MDTGFYFLIYSLSTGIHLPNIHICSLSLFLSVRKYLCVYIYIIVILDASWDGKNKREEMRKKGCRLLSTYYVPSDLFSGLAASLFLAFATPLQYVMWRDHKIKADTVRMTHPNQSRFKKDRLSLWIHRFPPSQTLPPEKKKEGLGKRAKQREQQQQKTNRGKKHL